MTIYLDIVFFENVLLNYIIMTSTALLSKSKIQYFKILFASIIGGVFSIVNYFIELKTNLIIKVLISILMILIAFRETSYIKFIKQLAIFYLVSFTFGGIAFMLIFFIEPQNVIYTDGHLVGIYPIEMTVLSGILGFIIVKIVSKINKSKAEMIFDLEIYYREKSCIVKSLVDSGNLLKEPISKFDVIIVEKNSLIDFFDEEFLKSINSIIDTNLIENNDIYNYKLKIIPFSSLGKDNGMLIGFKPDYVKIYAEDEMIRDDIIIGIYDGTLSQTDLYTSLMGLNIIDVERSKNGNFKKLKVYNTKNIWEVYL